MVESVCGSTSHVGAHNPASAATGCSRVRRDSGALWDFLAGSQRSTLQLCSSFDAQLSMAVPCRYSHACKPSLAPAREPGGRVKHCLGGRLPPDGPILYVAGARVETHPAGITLYNFEVASAHTYFVSQDLFALPLLVHNNCGEPPDISAERPKDVVPQSRLRVYRVEGRSNTRVVIRELRQGAILGDRTLFLNYGTGVRAVELLARRIQHTMRGAAIKSFKVPPWFLDELRATALTENDINANPALRGRPLLVDTTKAPDQFGLRRRQIEALRRAIIQGSGRTGL